MLNYTGISPEGLLLFSENRFRDSKEFYDAHKEEIKRLVLEPMQQIVEALADDLRAIDGQLNLTPSRVISRVRRDTRFSREKHLYRDHAWCTLMRPKGDPKDRDAPCWPCLWFEILADKNAWDCGVAMSYANPNSSYMRFFRERAAANPAVFLAAVEQAAAAGAEPRIEAFKRDQAPPGAPQALKPYLNAKGFYFIHNNPRLELFRDAGIIDILREKYRAFAGMYQFFLESAEDYLITTR
ncbi:MAG: DUF2461 domain-containing protein [Oscillospiraceae bacterium]|nr:DUF2461 domain-containing protein [Oscillospiraceae bacterium]